jgi:hypothetical protein
VPTEARRQQAHDSENLLDRGLTALIKAPTFFPPSGQNLRKFSRLRVTAWIGAVPQCQHVQLSTMKEDQ